MTEIICHRCKNSQPFSRMENRSGHPVFVDGFCCMAKVEKPREKILRNECESFDQRDIEKPDDSV